MKIKEFGVEIWMNLYENNCAVNIAETCVESLTINQLLTMAGKKETILEELLPMKLTYGAIEGSDRLRNNIAALYSNQSAHNVVVTHGAIGANALVHQTLVEPGDRVISVLPTYQQHYSIPESIGADVQILALREENDFLPDLEELRALVTPNTKLIAINNPNNPTGSLMNEAMLREIAKIAESVDAYVLCDEVYRGLDQEGSGSTISFADLYSKGISTGSMSKAFSLAGLRLGWIVGPEELIHRVAIHRDYNTISVGMIDDYFACIALEIKDKILARNLALVKENRSILDEWVNSRADVSYIKPQSGTTALLKYHYDMSSRDFCVGLLEHSGVMLTPGSALDVEGYARIGYSNSAEILREGLALMSNYLDGLAKA